MLDEMIRTQLKDAQKRLAHCERFIRNQMRALENYEGANEIEEARLTRQVLAAALRIREARRLKCETLQRQTSVAS